MSKEIIVIKGIKKYYKVGNQEVKALNGVDIVIRKNEYVAIMGQSGSVAVDRERYRTAGGVTGQWQRSLDARNQVSTFVQYNNLHYNTQEIRDADRWVGGAAYAHMWRDGAVGFGSAYLLKEKPQSSLVKYLGFDGFGIRLGSRANYGDRTTIFGGVSFERRAYDAQDPWQGVERVDKQYAALFGATYAFAKDWTLTPQISLTKNRTNAVLNEYHREVASVAIRREF